MLADRIKIFRWADGLFGLIIRRGRHDIFEPMDAEWIFGESELESWEIGQLMGGN